MGSTLYTNHFNRLVLCPLRKTELHWGQKSQNGDQGFLLMFACTCFDSWRKKGCKGSWEISRREPPMRGVPTSNNYAASLRKDDSQDLWTKSRKKWRLTRTVRLTTSNLGCLFSSLVDYDEDKVQGRISERAWVQDCVIPQALKGFCMLLIIIFLLRVRS